MTRVAAMLALVAGAVFGCANRPVPCTATSTDCPRILFIGNSYTQVNDLPGTTARLLEAAGRPVYVEMIAPGGVRLADHLATAATMARIADGHWSFVVLQEQSVVPAIARSRDSEMYPAARELVQAIRHAGARPVFYETWGRRDGWPDGGLADFTAMQRELTMAYRAIGSELSAMVAPVGEAWADSLAVNPRAVLWQGDGSHPTVAGTAIAARVMARTMFPGVRLR